MKILDNKTEKFGDDLKDELKQGDKVQIAASIFSIYGYEALKKELSKINEFNFIFRDQTFLKNESETKIEKFFEIQKNNFEKAISGTSFEVRLKNELNLQNIARECADWIEKKATFKSNSSNKVIANSIFNLVTNDHAITYFNTTNFTAEGLGYATDNSYSNVIVKNNQSDANQFVKNFDQMFNDSEFIDVTSEVIKSIKNLYKENSPAFIYYITLHNIFSEFLEDLNNDNLASEKIGFKNTVIYNKLFSFQKDAVNRIINKLETHNGCILADSVGLGKTFTALAVIKYYELRNKDVLVLCPKKLSDNWNTYRANYKDNILKQDRFSYDVLYHTDLNRTKGESNGKDLSKLDWANYGLIVIDESHNFRNNNARGDHETRYDILLNKVIKEGIKTKVLMLSATPVNNGFTDLNNQLNLAYEGEVDKINPLISKRKSISQILREAQTTFNKWSTSENPNNSTKSLYHELNKNFEFFKLLDEVTIARSRKQIEAHYNISEIGKFPIRNKPINLSPELTNSLNFMPIKEIYEQLGKLELVIYNPFDFIYPSKIRKYEELYDTKTKNGKILKQSDRQRSLQKLMRVNFMKRLESSVESFRVTLSKVLKRMELTINAIEKFHGTSESSDLEVSSEELEYEESQVFGKIKIDFRDMDTEAFMVRVKNDLKILQPLLEEFSKITIDKDQKLLELRKQIIHKKNNPINKGNQKIIIFTTYATTAEYLYQAISDLGKTALITGSGQNKNNVGLKNDYNLLLTFFSPISKSKSIIYPDKNEEIDILIATDCISEGQNLQDCDYLINYDIHWNPVRIIQRFGRIDRIGSNNEAIQLVNFWPNLKLDEYIKLKIRVENRMKILDLSSTGDENLLEENDLEMEFRKKQLAELQEQVIDLEDISSNISITNLGLNDFRMDLVEYVKTKGDISNIGSGMHSVVHANDKFKPGVIYILKNINKIIDFEHQNQIHPFYMIYVANDGKIIFNHLKPKEILEMMRKIAKGETEPINSAYQKFNEFTKNGKNMQHYSKLLSESIKSIINVNEESMIESLFSGNGIFKNQINGLDDFELITFLVIV